MKKNFLFVFLFGFFVEINWAFSEPEFGPNIPPVGSSLFDKIYSKSTGPMEVIYDVPYPLGDLLSRLQQEGTNFVYTFLPFSRSLQRPRDMSFDPLLNPRIVFTPFGYKSSMAHGRLFIGHLKAKDQLEIISYNDEAGRFEFQIVMDYGEGMIPQVFYADRGKCMSCHQSQAPIFSAAPWDDTGLGVMGDLVLNKLGLEENTASQRELAMEILFGDLGGARDSVGIFDSMVRDGDNIAFQQRVWKDGCGEDNRCRLGLLLGTLSPLSEVARDALRYSMDVLSESYLAEERRSNSFLSSSSLGIQTLVQRYGGLNAFSQNQKALAEAVNRLNNHLPPADNPSSPRWQSISSSTFRAPLAKFTMDDKATLLEEFGGHEKTAEYLISLFNQGDKIFESGPLNKFLILGRLYEEIGSPMAHEYLYWIQKPTPEKRLMSFVDLDEENFRSFALNTMWKNCAQCHATQLTFPPQFLKGSEEEVVMQIQSLQSRLLFRLENYQMPPDPVARQEMIDRGDYDIIVNYLRGL